MSDLPIIAGTLQTDPRSGGLKRSSGVNVLPIVSETWSEVRDDANGGVDWLIAGYVEGSRTDITVLRKGSGGVEACSAALPRNAPVFGGIRVRGRFVTFHYAGDADTPTMQKGRASLHKNGVLNVLEGSDCEIEMERGMTEDGVSVGGGEKSSRRAGASGARPKAALGSKQQKVSSAKSADPSSLPAEPTVASAAAAKSEIRARAPPPPTAPSPVTAKPRAEAESAANRSLSAEKVALVPYDRLRNVPTSELPEGVDPIHRERSLSEDEFQRVFGMTSDEFDALAAWKKNSLKKKHGLF